MEKLGFVFNGARCNGCGACVVACKMEKGLPDGVWLRKRFQNEHTMAFMTMGCNHCDDPACVKACPVKAYTKTESGLVVQNHSKCIGCQACVHACPYQAPSYSKTERKVFKCDACLKRISKGDKPACVANCPMGAIEFGPIEQLRAKYPQAREAGWDWARRNFGVAGPQATRPNLVIVPLKGC